MNNDYIDELSKLILYKKSILRQINVYFIKNENRDRLFAKLNEVENDIKRVKFKIRMERELKKNENSNTN